MSPDPDLRTQPEGVLDPRDPASRARLRAWLALARAFPLRPDRAREALARTGSPDAAARAGDRPPDPAAVERDLSTLQRIGSLALPVGSAAYPPRLAALPDAPVLLFVSGDASALLAPAVAVVGSRAPTGYGREVARGLAAELASAGLVVVSGLARGIDAAAHAAALDAGGITVAFQGCGPERVYPASHHALARRIAGAGAVATELPPGVPPLPHHFPLRNRLISGLAHAVVVVEARERSGSLTTALHAATQGRDVFAVPGPIDSPTSVGTNGLLRDGAFPFLHVGDVLLRLGLARRGCGAPPEGVARTAADPGRPEDRPSVPGPAHAAAVLRALRHAPATRDTLARRLGLAPSALALALVELELAGAVAEEPDGRLRATRGCAP